MTSSPSEHARGNEPRRPPSPQVAPRDLSLAEANGMGRPLAKWQHASHVPHGWKALIGGAVAVVAIALIIPVGSAANNAFITGDPNAGFLDILRGLIRFALIMGVVFFFVFGIRFLNALSKSQLTYLFEGGLLNGQRSGALRPFPWYSISKVTLYRNPWQKRMHSGRVALVDPATGAPTEWGFWLMPDEAPLPENQDKLRLVEHLARQAGRPTAVEDMDPSRL